MQRHIDLMREAGCTASEPVYMASALFTYEATGGVMLRAVHHQGIQMLKMWLQPAKQSKGAALFCGGSAYNIELGRDLP